MRRALLLLAVALGACARDELTSGETLSPEVTRVEVEIDYETGAAPYTGEVAGFGDVFDVTATNLNRLFAGKKKLVVPRDLAAMQDIGAVSDEALTADDILALADQHRNSSDGDGTKSYYVLFVRGHFEDEDGVKDTVLGVSIGGTSVVALFKDAIESTGVPLFPNIERFVEQSALVHELGHAIGLVDNGIPLVSAHKDEAHGAHCTNEDCVMFWLNEGASDAFAFARDHVTKGDDILFGDECLADVDALTGGP